MTNVDNISLSVRNKTMSTFGFLMTVVQYFNDTFILNRYTKTDPNTRSLTDLNGCFKHPNFPSLDATDP